MVLWSKKRVEVFECGYNSWFILTNSEEWAAAAYKRDRMNSHMIREALKQLRSDVTNCIILYIILTLYWTHSLTSRCTLLQVRGSFCKPSCSKEHRFLIA